MNHVSGRMLLVLGLAVLGAYVCGMFVDVMEIDAAQYAAMSMEMLQKKSFLHITDGGGDYLDKPPLIFWTSAISFGLFGISNFSYKLPSLLFAVLGVFSVYKFARLFYDRQTALLSAIFLASCQAFFLMTNDVRTDTLLTGAVAFSVWQLTAYLINGKWYHFVLGFSGIGVGMLAKGPIGLVIPAMAIGFHLLIKKRWKSILKWEWIPGLVIVCAWLLPMAIGLYQQFDLHPEKLINPGGQPGGDLKTGVSGLEFFFWTQSFGRITGQSDWQNDAGLLYFTHNVAWAFIPWSPLFICALFIEVRKFFRKKEISSESIALGGFVLTFLALSLSKFKLPHYIFVTFPFAALILAKYFMQLIHIHRIFPVIQVSVSVLVWVTGILLCVLAFPFPPSWVMVVGLICLASSTGILFINYLIPSRQISLPARIITSTVITMVGVNFLMSGHVYPVLLKFQAQSQIAHYINENGISPECVYNLNAWGRSMNFYLERIMSDVDVSGLDKFADTIWVHSKNDGIDFLRWKGVDFQIVKEFDDFSVTRLSFRFLNPETRHEVVGKRYLLQIVPKGSDFHAETLKPVF